MIAALCDRLEVTKGSFYHHFADIDDCVAAVAAGWRDEFVTQMRDYSAIVDPRRRWERLCEDSFDRLTGVEPAMFAWARAHPAPAAAEAALLELAEIPVVDAFEELVGDAALGELLARAAVCTSIGVTVRCEPLDRDWWKAMQCEFTRRVLGIEAELVEIGGIHQVRLLDRECAQFPIDPKWHRPVVRGVPATAGPTAAEFRPRTRMAYFRAAYALLADGGFEAVTVAGVCSKLSVTKGSFRHHFGGMPPFVEQLSEHWEQAWVDGLDRCRTHRDPLQRLAHLLGGPLRGPDPMQSAWRAWAHSAQAIQRVTMRIDRLRQDLLATTIAELGADEGAAEMLAEMTLAWMIGVQRPQPRLTHEQIPWMVVEWARRVLRVGADLHLDRGRVALVIRKPGVGTTASFVRSKGAATDPTATLPPGCASA